MEALFENKTYSKTDFTQSLLDKGDYENCIFEHCNFLHSDFSKTKFIDCTFTACNLSMIQLGDSVFRDCRFTECKMLGLHFEDCNEYGLSILLSNCVLNHSSFYQTKMKGVRFNGCQLEEVDFTLCDLTQASFANCDLLNAKFENTMLEKTDFRTARNYSINPAMNKIRKARFSLPEVLALLDHYDIQVEGFNSD